MKILFLHNNYRISAGEDLSIKSLMKLCESNGISVDGIIKSSADIGSSLFSKLSVLPSSIKNSNSLNEISKKLDEFKPDVVFVQNLYPLISLESLKLIKNKGYPIIMRCPNYRIFCPNGLFFDSRGNICEKCAITQNEFWCFKKKCEENYLKSAVYAARNYYARKNKIFKTLVDVFIVQSFFQKGKFIEYGIQADKIEVLPGLSLGKHDSATNMVGEGVAFIGRLEKAKGFNTFIKAAVSLPEIPFYVAGKPKESFDNLDVPENVQYLGFLNNEEVDDLIQRSRIIAVPSEWYEGFPNTITKSMFKKKAIITTDLGAMSSIIRDDVNGKLFEAGNAIQLADIIKNLYPDTKKVNDLGTSAYKEAVDSYSEHAIFNKLNKIFNRFRNQFDA